MRLGIVVRTIGCAGPFKFSQNNYIAERYIGFVPPKINLPRPLECPLAHSHLHLSRSATHSFRASFPPRRGDACKRARAQTSLPHIVGRTVNKHVRALARGDDAAKRQIRKTTIKRLRFAVATPPRIAPAPPTTCRSPTASPRRFSGQSPYAAISPAAAVFRRTTPASPST